MRVSAWTQTNLFTDIEQVVISLEATVGDLIPKTFKSWG
jgi:hypothetical protein